MHDGMPPARPLGVRPSDPAWRPPLTISRSEPRSRNHCLEKGHCRKIVGGVISPLLANMVLDGLEHRLADRIRQRKTTNGKVVYNPKINLIGYADDLVVTGD